MLGHLPAAHPFARVLERDAPDPGIAVRVLTHHDERGRLVGIDHGVAVAIIVPAWRQLYVVPLDGESVVVFDAADDGTLTPVAAYRAGRLIACQPTPEPATAASDEVVRHQVDAQLEELCGHLPAELVAELRADIDADDVEWTPNLAAETHAGRLALLTPGRRRAYLLDQDRDGQTFGQVTSLDEDGTASSAKFRDRELVAGQVARIVLEPKPPDADDPDETAAA